MSETKSSPRRTTGAKGKGTYSDVVDGLQDVLNGIPDRPTKGLMTFEELQARMGSKPKKDRFFGKYKMSTRYKAIGEALEAVKAELRNATLGSIAEEGGRDAFEQSLMQRLDDVVAAGKRYQKKHTGKKGAAVQSLLDDVERVRKEIPPKLDLLTQGQGPKLPEDLPVDQALAAQRAGIKPEQLKGISVKHCNFTAFNDEVREADPKQLGKGAVNTVHLVKHGGVERVFKKEQTSDKSGAWAPGMMGLDPQNDPRYGNRNVAGGAIGRLLGTSVMPQVSFGISDGEVGLLMDKAPGKTARSLLKDKDFDLHSLSPKAQASLQRQLMDLEVCDILTGQSDRHGDNYMIEINGDEVKVTGIDNDFAFPNSANAISKEIPPKFLGMNSIGNLPALMSKEIADRIKAIDFDRDVAPSLADLLTPAEIGDTAARFQKLREHVAALEKSGSIVDDWQRWRGPPPERLDAGTFLAGQKKSQDSLFKREFGKFF